MSWIAGALMSLALCALAELSARYWIRFRNRYYMGPPGLRRRLSPDRSALPEYEPVIRIEINSDGERGAEVRGRNRGLYRILAAGGSPVEGYSLDQASNWPAVLERILNTPDNLLRLGATRVHAGSIGRSGVASHDLDLILRRVLPQYRRLDAIVIMIGGNDVANWLACGAPPDAPAPPLPTVGIFGCHPEGPFGWRPARWGLVELLKRWRRRWLRPVEERHNAGRWIVEARAMRARATDVRTSVSDPTAMLNNFEQCFRRLLRRSQAHATRVLALRQPWFETDYTPQEVARFWHGAAGLPWKGQAVSVYYALDVVNQLMALVDARAAKVAEEMGVEQLGLRSVLQPSLDTYFDYVHYTPAGARVVAEAVAARLLLQQSATADDVSLPPLALSAMR